MVLWVSDYLLHLALSLRQHQNSIILNSFLIFCIQLSELGTGQKAVLR